MSRFVTLPLMCALVVGLASAQTKTSPAPSGTSPASPAGPRQDPASKTGQAPTKTETKKGSEPKSSSTAAPTTRGPKRELRLAFRTFDTVLAIVGERIITLSDVRPEIDAKMLEIVETAKMRNPNAQMPPEEKRRWTWRWAWALAQREAMTLQMLGNIKNMQVPEERVQQVINDNVERKIAQDITTAGSSMALYDNLRAQGKTFEEYKAELRDQITLQIIRSQNYTKYLDGGNLKVTPAEMWDYYREHSKDYQREAKAKIELFRLRLNEDETGVLSKAAELRRELMAGGDSKKLARKYRAVRHIQDLDPEGGQVAILSKFAFSRATQVDSWSLPEVSGPHVYIIHLLSRNDAGLKSFKDTEVQRQIRSKILQSRIEELNRKQQSSHIQNLSIWPPALLTSQEPQWPQQAP